MDRGAWQAAVHRVAMGRNSEAAQVAGQRERRGEGEGEGRVVQGLVGCQRTWIFTLRKVGALESCGQRSETWLRCSQVPSGCFGKDRLWGTSAGAVGPGRRELC